MPAERTRATRGNGEAVGGNRRLRLAHLRALAVLGRWDGDGAAALEHLQEARGLAGEIGLPGELWQIGAALGELHGELGNGAEARGTFSLPPAGHSHTTHPTTSHVRRPTSARLPRSCSRAYHAPPIR